MHIIIKVSYDIKKYMSNKNKYPTIIHPLKLYIITIISFAFVGWLNVPIRWPIKIQIITSWANLNNGAINVNNMCKNYDNESTTRVYANFSALRNINKTIFSLWHLLNCFCFCFSVFFFFSVSNAVRLSSLWASWTNVRGN